MNYQPLQSYTTTIDANSHWSLMVRRGITVTITAQASNANVGMLLFNPTWLTEKYNAPDTLKCQHTFKLSKGHCLFSDMGRIFCSVVEDNFGWHDTLCGNSNSEQLGKADYQAHSNDWQQNGNDAFLVELAKYGLSKRDMAANVNWFSEVRADEQGDLALTRSGDKGDAISLRFEMDTLVMLHTCPHPLSNSAKAKYASPVDISLEKSAPITSNDLCLNACDETRRGFDNNALYHLGLPS